MGKISVLLPKRTIVKRLLHSTPPSHGSCLEQVYVGKCFEGEQRFYSHESNVVNCRMDFGVYLPPKAIIDKVNCPVLYFLNGRTATHENMIRKSAFQRFAALYGICAVSPDTSPRNVPVPADNNLGPGASYYVNATQPPYAKYYQMFTYVTDELIEVINANFPVIEGKQSISGLSMGGYGALICALKKPELYLSVSVFAPVCNPMCNTYGQQAMRAYFGENKDEWKKWDPCLLAKSYSGKPMEVLLDQGTCDNLFLDNLLAPENFVCAAENNKNLKVVFKQRDGYNHSHYYLATFIDEHIEYHAKALNS